MASERSLTFYFVATLLTSNVHLDIQTIGNNGTAEKTSDKGLTPTAQCLSRCGIHKAEQAKTRSSSHSLSPKQPNMKDSNCYRNCLEGYKKARKRIVRSTTNEASNTAKYDCPSDIQTTEQALGEIQNLSVVFLQQRDKDANVTWIANITWDVLMNQSIYYSDELKGFLITWDKANESPASTTVYCRFIFKNTTNYIINSGSTGWVYPDAINVGVAIYPPPKDIYEGFTTVTFYPIKDSKQSEQTTIISTNTPKTISQRGQTTTNSTDIPKTISQRGQTTRNSTDTPKTISQEPQLNDPVLPIVFGCFVGSVFVCVVLYLMWKKRKKKETHLPDQENYEYDASILYSTRDEEWVTSELIPLLETQNNFKCFIHFRDFEIGRVLHENMADAVNKCRKNLAVVSNNFLNSNYCKEELHMALERVQRLRDCSLIVVNLDGVSKERLPKALLGRTYVNLTNSQERNTWKSRLVRQISVEEQNSVRTNPQSSYVRIHEDRSISVLQDEHTFSNESAL